MMNDDKMSGKLSLREIWNLSLNSVRELSGVNPTAYHGIWWSHERRKVGDISYQCANRSVEPWPWYRCCCWDEGGSAVPASSEAWRVLSARRPTFRVLAGCPQWMCSTTFFYSYEFWLFAVACVTSQVKSSQVYAILILMIATWRDMGSDKR